MEYRRRSRRAQQAVVAGRRKTPSLERRSPGGSGGRRLRRFPPPSQRPMQPPTAGGLSWWLWPLRGGHGRGLRRFAAVVAEVFAPSWWSRRRSFIHRHKNNAKNRFTCDFRLFHHMNLLGVCASSRHLRRQAIFSAKSLKRRRKKPKKSHLHWPWAVVMWRSSPRRLGGHGGLLRTRPVVYLGGLSWFFNLAVKTP